MHEQHFFNVPPPFKKKKKRKENLVLDVFLGLGLLSEHISEPVVLLPVAKVRNSLLLPRRREKKCIVSRWNETLCCSEDDTGISYGSWVHLHLAKDVWQRALVARFGHERAGPLVRRCFFIGTRNFKERSSWALLWNALKCYACHLFLQIALI